MTARWRLDVAFDGTDFSGWQVQPGRRTVQGELRRALSRVGEEGIPIGAGRTDAGVHALDLPVHVDLERSWSPGELARAVGLGLPRDLRLLAVRPVPEGFHVRFDARTRTYHYALSLTDNPFFRLRRWVVPVLPSTAWIQGELEVLREWRDFASFARTGGGTPGTECRIAAASWRPARRGAVLLVTADRFLYGMVRALVGALVTGFARGEASGHVARVLAGTRRSEAGKAAPAAGLYLVGASYAGDPEVLDRAALVACLAGLAAQEERA